MESKFVKENRAANADEINAIKKALDEFGVKDVCSDIAFLFGRYDAPYGWYLFYLNVNNSHKEKFLILGDCLDVLPDYNRMLTLKEVHEFASSSLDGRYEAIQEWGVFHSISRDLRVALEKEGITVREEAMTWDIHANNWRLAFRIASICDGKPTSLDISINPFLGSSKESDNEFFEQWWKHYTTVSRKNQVEAEASVDEQGYVWVMTIMVDGQNFPEVHKTFDGAVESAINDIKEKMSELEEDEREEYDFDDIKKRLEEDRYWKDENTDTSYDIVDCPVSK